MSSSYNALKDQLKYLKKSAENIEDALEAITMESAYIYKVGPDMNIDRGNSCAGIFKVTTERGTGILKIHKQPAIHYGLSVLMQQALANLGRSPEVYGYLPEKEMEKAVLQHQIHINPADWVSFGVVMAEVDGAWNYIRGYRRRPDYFSTLNLDSLVGQIREIQEDLNQLRIIARDAEFIISSSGHVFIFDLDKSIWVSEKNKYYGFDAGSEMEEDGAMLRKAPKPLPIHNDFSDEIEILQRVFRS